MPKWVLKSQTWLFLIRILKVPNFTLKQHSFRMLSLCMRIIFLFYMLTNDKLKKTYAPFDRLYLYWKLICVHTTPSHVNWIQNLLMNQQALHHRHMDSSICFFHLKIFYMSIYQCSLQLYVKNWCNQCIQS